VKMSWLNDLDHNGLNNLVELLNIEKKREVKKYCRDFVVRSEDLFHLILAGNASSLKPYKYKSHFSEMVPSHLNPTDYDLSALASNGVGPMSHEANKTATKIGQIFKDRRLFAAHLLYMPDGRYWHLFYFDQRDIDKYENHWNAGGPHIHYSRESFCRKSLAEMWSQVCLPIPKLPSSIHIRYDYHHHR